MLLLDNIKFTYSGGKELFSLCVDKLQFESALISCVIGENGSGKTTLLNLIGGHVKADSGRIILSGTDITELRAETRPTSTVFQQIGLFPHMTVRENIELAIEPNSLFKKSINTKVKA